MKKLFSALLSSAVLTAVLVLSQYQTKAGTIDVSSIVVTQDAIPQASPVAAQYSYWVLINSGWAAIVVQQ